MGQRRFIKDQPIYNTCCSNIKRPEMKIIGGKNLNSKKMQSEIIVLYPEDDNEKLFIVQERSKLINGIICRQYN